MPSYFHFFHLPLLSRSSCGALDVGGSNEELISERKLCPCDYFLMTWKQKPIWHELSDSVSTSNCFSLNRNCFEWRFIHPLKQLQSQQNLQKPAGLCLNRGYAWMGFALRTQTVATAFSSLHLFAFVSLYTQSSAWGSLCLHCSWNIYPALGPGKKFTHELHLYTFPVENYPTKNYRASH